MYKISKQISIHALLAESDNHSTTVWLVGDDFYPRSPCGERPVQLAVRANAAGISIHALLAESDGIVVGWGGAGR